MAIYALGRYGEEDSPTADVRADTSGEARRKYAHHDSCPDWLDPDLTYADATGLTMLDAGQEIIVYKTPPRH